MYSMGAVDYKFYVLDYCIMSQYVTACVPNSKQASEYVTMQTGWCSGCVGQSTAPGNNDNHKFICG